MVIALCFIFLKYEINYSIYWASPAYSNVMMIEVETGQVEGEDEKQIQKLFK